MLELTGGTFFTALYGIIDTKEMVMNFARGGHCLPILIHEKKIADLHSHGIFMGLESNITFENARVSLAGSDKIIFYTDGLVEEKNSERKEFLNIFKNETLSQSNNLPFPSIHIN